MEASLNAAGIGPEDYAQTAKLDPGLDMNSEAKAWKTIWSAGHGVSAIEDCPSTEELIKRLQNEFEQALEMQQQRLNHYKQSK
jgi:nitronate monooxygenase